MNESITRTTKQFTGCASLAALGVKLRELKLFEPIEQQVQIAQKTIKDKPTPCRVLCKAEALLRGGAERILRA